MDPTTLTLRTIQVHVLSLEFR